MARPRTQKKRITAPPYAIGYAVLRPLAGGPRWYTRIGSGSYIATPYTDAPGATEKVRQLLKERIEAYLNPNAATIIPVSIRDLVEEYDAARLQTAGASKRRQFEAAVRAYLDAALPLDEQRIIRHITAALKRATHSSATRGNYLIRLRQLFAYAVHRQYMTANPIEGITLPRVVHLSPSPFVVREMRLVRLWFLRHATRRAYLFIRLQSLTGMRKSEILGLKKGDITNGRLRIHGKSDRVRYFPLLVPPDLATRRDEPSRLRVALLRQIDTTLRELVALTPENELFPDKREIRSAMERCRTALAGTIDIKQGTRRSTHAIRKYALWFLRERCRLSADQRADLAGHSKDIAREHYEVYTPKELADATFL